MNTRQQGFSIVMATFILVVLGLLGGYMVRLSGVQQVVAIDALQGARAYQTAHAGLGWAMAKIKAGGDCTSIPGAALTIDNFSVYLTCSATPYTEGDKAPIVYALQAFSESSAGFGSNDYVSRTLEASIVMQ